MSKLNLFCNICKSKKMMTEAKIPKFSKRLRIIGVFTAIASIIGLFIAVIFFLSAIGKEHELIGITKNISEAAEAVIVAELDLSYSLFLGCLSLLGGLTSWILFMKKKVYRCLGCDHVFKKSAPSLQLGQGHLK